MVDLRDVRYVRLGTSNLSSAIDYATKIVGLQLVRREAKAAYFRSDNTAGRGDAREHTLVYFEGNPSHHAVGFDLRTPNELDSVAKQLEEAGFHVEHGTHEQCEQRAVHAFIGFNDHTCISTAKSICKVLVK